MNDEEWEQNFARLPWVFLGGSGITETDEKATHLTTIMSLSF